MSEHIIPLVKYPHSSSAYIPIHDYPDEFSRYNSLGKPCQKYVFSWTHLLVVLGSLSCAAIAIYVIAPRSLGAWMLGYNGQLITIGFMISLQYQCLLTLSVLFFSCIEQKFRRSILQNYDAIIRSSFLAHDADLSWRVVLVALIALPMGLGAVYKSAFYRGGVVARSLPMDDYRYATVASPGVWETGGGHGSTGLTPLMNSSTPFMAAAKDDNSPPPFAALPHAYGFNTLLLTNTSVAVLDAPQPAQILAIQRNLSTSKWPIDRDNVGHADTVRLTAQVNAVVATYNPIVESQRDNPNFWAQFNDSERAFQPSYHTYSMAFIANEFASTNNTWCFIGIVPDASRQGLSDGTFKTAFQAFNQTLLYFNIERRKCLGMWTVTKTTVDLTGGFCYPPNASIAQDSLTDQFLAPSSFFLPVLGEYLIEYGPRQDNSRWENNTARPNSPWKVPSFTATVAYMYWARILAVAPDDASYVPDQGAFGYRSVIHPHWSLYVLLAIQPFFCMGMFLGCIAMRSSPIGPGFGMVSVLAGVRKSTLDKLEGASYSGKLRTQAALTVNEGLHSVTERYEVEYSIRDAQSS